MAEKCTKTSLPPSSGAMKPYPFSALDHLTVPEAMSDPLSRHSRVGTPGPCACVSAVKLVAATTAWGNSGESPKRDVLSAFVLRVDVVGQEETEDPRYDSTGHEQGDGDSDYQHDDD